MLEEKKMKILGHFTKRKDKSGHLKATDDTTALCQKEERKRLTKGNSPEEILGILLSSFLTIIDAGGLLSAADYCNIKSTDGLSQFWLVLPPHFIKRSNYPSRGIIDYLLEIRRSENEVSSLPPKAGGSSWVMMITKPILSLI